MDSDRSPIRSDLTSKLDLSESADPKELQLAARTSVPSNYLRPIKLQKFRGKIEA